MKIKVLLGHWPIKKSSLVFGSSYKIIFIFHRSVWTYLYNYIYIYIYNFISPPYFSFGSISIYITWWFILYAPTLSLVLLYGRYFVPCFVSLCWGLFIASLCFLVCGLLLCVLVQRRMFWFFYYYYYYCRWLHIWWWVFDVNSQKKGLFDRCLHTINMVSKGFILRFLYLKHTSWCYWITLSLGFF